MLLDVIREGYIVDFFCWLFFYVIVFNDNYKYYWIIIVWIYEIILFIFGMFSSRGGMKWIICY